MTRISKPLKRLGIISGAGPLAGVLFLKKLLETYQAQGAWQDNDFPYITLINYPFSEMLSSDHAPKVIQDELLSCIHELQDKCDYMIITCNTLHLFLPDNYENNKLIDIFSILNEVLPDEPLYVVASRTSAQNQLHEKKLKRPCQYLLPEKTQEIINDILKGKKVNLQWLEKIAAHKKVLLGCTELSIPVDEGDTFCIDPYPYIIHHIMHLLQS